MWIVIPSTCSPSAPASAGSTSELSLQQAEALASSVTLSGKLSRPASWRRAWKTKPWLRHLSGATCEPSTAALGVESWIASLAATRANRSASLVSDVGRTILATFGRRSLESLRRLNPHSVSSRTSEGTYLSGSTLFGTSFREWGFELRRDFSRRQKLARRIGGSVCSSWPTASASVANDRESMESWEARKARNLAKHTNGNGMGTPLTVATVQWASPVVSDAYRSGPLTEKQLNRDRGAPKELSADVATWASPRTSDTNGAGSHGTGGIDLRTQVGRWPTPGANDHKGSAKDGQRRGQLDEATEQKWQTPATDSFRSRGGDRKDEMGLDQQARGFPCSLPDQATAPSGSESCEPAQTSRPRLNPAFVEWMMGLPINWTEF